MDSDSNENDDNGDETESFRHLTEQDLEVQSSVLDDLFCGTSSKLRWERKPGQEGKRFSPSSELAYYVNQYMKPALRQLFQSNQVCLKHKFIEQ